MKIKYIKYLTLATVMAFASCSKDYLDTYPTDETSPTTVFKTTEMVEMAVNGLAKLMVTQHISQGFNGEGTIKMYYGEYAGNNFRVNLPGWGPIINGAYFDNTTSIYDYYPWHYYYMLITNANQIIDQVDAAEGNDAKKKQLKAQALGYRAYSYTMLAQLYGYRWDDSNNGAQECLILRRSMNDPISMPLSSLSEVYKAIYEDLDQAITLAQASGLDRKKFFEMNQDVYHAIYARAALAKKDYPTAEKHAALAKANYRLMNEAEYKSGFSNPTDEWIWGSYGASDEQLHFYAYHAYIAYNSSASAVRVYPKRISKELFDQIPDTDIRKGLFLDPKEYEGEYSLTTGEVEKPETSKMDKDTRAKYPELRSDALVAAYMQFKIKANDMPGVGNINHFRSSEMYLIEAEAQYFQQNYAAAKATLTELNKTSGRDTAYDNSALTDAELFKQIVNYRGLELWGEGFDWFDMKRWNLDIDRKEGGKGGNYVSSLAVKIPANIGHKWTWKTPAREVDYNSELK
ncbi:MULTISPECIES: RagB/SusD family nutrient uptake outer membrane protein [Myroides]|uniref:RagB/SusD family nutrient uptake outer membrane protein n=1 Tax=Myroides odoratus TaxID=256 RepID=UPI0024C0BC71|nr:RagB/SusD family nutrient uptake outer membrane protein [Myroides sp. mNGS23_01]WHT37910.1 RagB/SusD family nutrient uptake outer membrane protein [Myroides sp. mNGS23_01]